MTKQQAAGCKKEHRRTQFQVIISGKLALGVAPASAPASGDQHLGGSMVIKFGQTSDGSDDSISFQPVERLKVYLFGAIVLFASFGMGETVYRLLFSEFDGPRTAFPSKLYSDWLLPGWQLSSSEIFTETVRSGEQDLTSYGLAIIRSAAHWKESLRWPIRRKISSRSESSARRLTGLSGR